MSCFSCFSGGQDQGRSPTSKEADPDDALQRLPTGCSQPELAKSAPQVSISGRLSSKQHSKVIESLEALHEAGMPAPLNVSCCEPSALVKDVHELRWVGQGSQGVVYEGIWQGAVVAVKWSIAEQLDTGACELLFSRLLGHPNVVQTYDAKVAVLDSQIFDQDYLSVSSGPHSTLSAHSSDRHIHGTNGTIAEQTLDARSDSYKSEEGFGNPFGRHSSFNDVRDMLRLIGAKPGQCITQMIMEYCDQGSLLTAISRGIFLPTSRFGPKVALRALFRTAREISQGMVHLHQANVVHGDLKPANVLLMNSRKDRRGFIAKISDFGLAQYCPASRGVVENAPWGTLVFMAPERFCSNRLEPASDVWALGVLMWQMYTARLPYEGITQAKLLQGISNGNLHLTWPAGSPASLVNMVAWCMARLPHQRPTFETLIHELATLESDVRMEGFRLSNSVELQHSSDDAKTLIKSLSSKNAASGQISTLTVCTPPESPRTSQKKPSSPWRPNPLATRHSQNAPAHGPAAPSSPVPGQTGSYARTAHATSHTNTVPTTQSSRASPTSPQNSRLLALSGQGGLCGTTSNSECSAVSSSVMGPRNTTRSSSVGPMTTWAAVAISEASGMDSKQSTQTSLETPGLRSGNTSSLDAPALLRFGSTCALIVPDQDNVVPTRAGAVHQEATGSWSCVNAGAETTNPGATTWGALAQAKRSQVMSRFAQGLRSPDAGEPEFA